MNKKLLIGIIAGVLVLGTIIGCMFLFKHEHIEETMPAVAPTCESTGLTEGKKCSDCGEIIVAQQIVAANGHTEAIDSAVAPTCTSTGLTDGKHCVDCEKVLVSQNTVEKLPHTEVIDPALEPTCTATGLTEGKHCSVCGEITLAQTEVAIKPHTEVTIPAVAATCTATGLTEGKKCLVCNTIIVAQETVPMLSHTYDYEYDRFCNVCNYERQINCRHDIPERIEIVPAKSPTCVETGLTEGMKCTICDTMVLPQTVIPTTECIDLRTLPYVAPTCMATGLTAGKQCNICNTIVVEQTVVAAIDCIAGDWIVDKEATKTEDGKRYQNCIMCGEKTNEEIIPATGSIGLKYTLNSDGQSYSVTGIGTCTDTEIVIPNIYNGLPVTNIGNTAFWFNSSIANVIIGENVTHIGELAFVESSITQIEFSDSVISIGQGAFWTCRALTTVVITKNIENVEFGAFGRCTALENIFVDEDNQHYQSIDGNLYTKDGKTLVSYASGKEDTSFEILDSVTSIGVYAFAGCTSLTSITIPDSVTSIGYSAFYGCSSLTIYCEVASKPSGWEDAWNDLDNDDNKVPTVWYTYQPMDYLNTDMSEYVTLGEYKNMIIDVDKIEVSEEELNLYIQLELAKGGKFTKLFGGTVFEKVIFSFDYTGYYMNDDGTKGMVFEGGSSTNQLAYIDGDTLCTISYYGVGSFIDGFAQGIINQTIGDTFDIEITFPSNYVASNLAGKTTIFTIKLNYIAQTNLTDDLVKEITNNQYATCEEYIEYIRESLNNEINTANIENVWQIILDNAEIIEIPTQQFNYYYNSFVSQIEQYVLYSEYYFGQRLTFDEVLVYLGFENEEALKEYARDIIKNEMIIFALIQAEEIEVTDVEYQNFLELLMQQTEKTEEEVLQQYGGKDTLIKSILLDKADQFVLDANTLV